MAWLQFTFPFYIWMIVGIIIYLSRCSTTVVKLVGSSAVSVLATLFLLSYTKLQRTVITAFSFTYLHNYHEDGRPLAVCMAVRWECPFSPRKAHSLVPDGMQWLSQCSLSFHSPCCSCLTPAYKPPTAFIQKIED